MTLRQLKSVCVIRMIVAENEEIKEYETLTKEEKAKYLDYEVLTVVLTNDHVERDAYLTAMLVRDYED